MSTAEIHEIAVWAMFVFAAVTVIGLVFIRAPYGRHSRGGWGPEMPSRAGWILMESPAVVFVAVIFFYGDHRAETVPLVLLGLWMFHYVHRTFIFPFRMRIAGKRTPILIVAMAFGFNCLNAYVNARWISHLGTYESSWLADPRFLIGGALFFAGFAINFTADSILFRLRKPGETGYKIPRGKLYEVVSCPNYLGEIMEWVGWAIATWSLAGLAFAAYAAANLAPRAFHNHAWYKEKFGDDYPARRKALIPFIA